MSSFNDTGLVIDRLDDIRTKLEDALKDAFGDNIKIGADSVFGQIINIFAEAIADQNELIEGIVNAYNPQSATGVYLSNLVLLNGIERKESEYSSVFLQCTANSAGTTIPAGSLVSDPAIGEQFATDLELVVAPFATGQVSATAVNPGPIVAEVNTLTQIDTPVYGWESVTNPASATVGQNEEADSELRVRRYEASKQTGLSNIAAIFTAINNIDAVELVSIYENNTTETDSNGVPKQHIWAIVKGGNDQDIAGALFNTVAAGIGYWGDNPVAYDDPITGQIYTITFERPEDVEIYITVTLEKYSNYPADGDNLIKQSIIDYFNGDFTIDGNPRDGFQIGEDILYSRIYTPINAIDGHSITDLRIGTSPSPTGQSNIIIAPNEVGVTQTTNIVILEA